MKLSKAQQKKINEFRNLFPSEISCYILRSEDGGFSAEVLTFPGVVTEADSFSELVEMINDAVRTYFEVPEEYTSFVPSYIPSIKTAQNFNAFPVIEMGKRVKMKTRASEREKN